MKNKKLVLGVASLALLGAALVTTTSINVEAKGGSILNSGIINSFKTETAKVGEHTISYKIRKGNANPTKTYILSHGATGTGEFFNVAAAELAKKEPNARIIIIDLPLHGGSTGPIENLEDITVHDYADVVYDFINQKKEDGTIKGKLNWTGWSMGGSIGLLLDLKGANIDELVLLNSAPYWQTIEGLVAIMPPETIKEIFYSVVESQLDKNVTDAERQEILESYNSLVTESSEVMAQDFKAILPEHYDVRDLLDKVQAKTLIISGTGDDLAEIKYQELMDEKIADSKLVMFEDNHLQLIKPVQAKKIVNEMDAFFNAK